MYNVIIFIVGVLLWPTFIIISYIKSSSKIQKIGLISLFVVWVLFVHFRYIMN